MSTSEPIDLPLILVADDNEDMRDLYKLFLERQGMRVVLAEIGEAAVAKTRAGDTPPSLIVMDLMMPGMGGIEAIRTLKSDPTTHAIPIVALTANHTDGARAAAISACCDRFLCKPCLPHDLAAQIRELLNRRDN